METQKLKHVVWDWNGTLLDDVQITISLINDILERDKKNVIDLNFFKENVCFPISLFYKQIGYHELEIPARMREWFQRYEQNVENCELQGGASQALNLLANSSFSQSILSAHSHNELTSIVEKKGLTNKFWKISGACEQTRGISKLNIGRQLVNEISSEFEAAPNEIVLIGDSLHDYEVASSLGLQCVLVEHGIMSRTRLEATGSPVFSDISAAVGYLLDTNPQ